MISVVWGEDKVVYSVKTITYSHKFLITLDPAINVR
jgi:hypothetical protein